MRFVVLTRGLGVWLTPWFAGKTKAFTRFKRPLLLLRIICIYIQRFGMPHWRRLTFLELHMTPAPALNLSRFSSALVLAALAAWGGQASAHMVWLERDGAAPMARAYFGEWAEDVREKTGGYLDMIKGAQAFGTDLGKAYTVTRKSDHLEIAATGTGDVRLAEALLPREDKAKGGKSRTVFHAKAGRTETAAKLDFEIVPTAPNANAFVLTFKGQPVPKAPVTVFGPPKWSKVLHTDAEGRFSITTPWKGRYVIETAYQDNTAGEAAGAAFDRSRHVGTLSFEATEGLPWSQAN